MHIHGNPNLNVANLHPAGAAGATQRAAEVRKKLLNANAPIAEESEPDAVSMVARWSEDSSEDGPPEQPDPPARHSEAGQSANHQEPDDHPVSFWA